MKKSVVLTVLCTLILCAAAFAEDLGSVVIPRNVTIAGISVSAGTYTVALVDEGGKLMFQLKQGGNVVVSELSIIKPAEKSYSQARIMYQPLKRGGADDPLRGRVYVNYKGNLYLLYCEK